MSRHDETLSFLMECFPETDFEILLQAVHHSETKDEAIDYILAATARGPSPVVSPTETLLAQLAEVFPEINLKELSEAVKRKDPDEDLEDLIDDVMVMKGLYAEIPSEERWNTVKESRRQRKRVVCADQLSFKSGYDPKRY